jgi:hypothetical protein
MEHTHRQLSRLLFGRDGTIGRVGETEGQNQGQFQWQKGEEGKENSQILAR